MAMASISEALLAASAFLGLGSFRGEAQAADRPTGLGDERIASRSPPSGDSAASGDRWLQAVAEALVEAGYIDA